MSNTERGHEKQKVNIPDSYTKRSEQLVASSVAKSSAIQKASANPNSLIQSDILQLQKTIGNQALIQLMQPAELSNNHPSKTSSSSVQGNVVQRMKLIDNSFDTRNWPDWLPQMLKGAALVDNWETLELIREALRRKGALAQLPFHEQDVFLMIHKATHGQDPDIEECQQRFQRNTHVIAAPDQAELNTTVDVPTGNCKTADHNQKISTSGLTWCIAVGIRGETDKKKILFHIIGGEVENTDFENKTEYERWASIKGNNHSWDNRFKDHFDELEGFIMGQQNTTMFILFGGNHDTEARRSEFIENPRVAALMGEVTRVKVFLGNSIIIANDDTVEGNCAQIN